MSDHLPDDWVVDGCPALSYRQMPLGLPFEMSAAVIFGGLAVAFLGGLPITAAASGFALITLGKFATREDPAFAWPLWKRKIGQPDVLWS